MQQQLCAWFWGASGEGRFVSWEWSGDDQHEAGTRGRRPMFRTLRDSWNMEHEAGQAWC
jgi:hypothetical protein